MFCRNCGVEIGPDASFCSNCGTRQSVDARPEYGPNPASSNGKYSSIGGMSKNTAMVLGFVISLAITIFLGAITGGIIIVILAIFFYIIDKDNEDRSVFTGAVIGAAGGLVLGAILTAIFMLIVWTAV